MKERPILFSGEMVKAILDGRKSQTRRAMKPQPELGNWHGDDCKTWKWKSCTFVESWFGHSPLGDEECPYGQPGDLLWCKETFAINDIEHGWDRPLPKQRPRFLMNDEPITYRADGDWEDQFGMVEGDIPPWRPSIFMPRWASRITLEITDVRVERLQSISNWDAIAEGLYREWDGSKYWYGKDDKEGSLTPHPRIAFATLWDSINGKTFPWDSNPFVWCIAFKRLTKSEE